MHESIRVSMLIHPRQAYSWHNPEIGYCQSMNFIAAVCLLYVDEPTAFAMLATIVEMYMPPGY